MHISLICLISLIFVVKWNFNDAKKEFSVDLIESRTHVDKGKDVTITCRVRTNIAPTLKWLRDEIDVRNIVNWTGTIDQTKTHSQEREADHCFYESVLRIKPEANYTFSCVASNDQGSIRMDTDIFVGVSALITNLTQDPRVPQPKGHNVTVHCTVASIPQPEIVWRYVDAFDSKQDGQDQEVDVDEQFQVVTEHHEGFWLSTLHLFPVSIDATYSCNARNPYGTDEKKIEVATVDLEIGQGCDVDLDCSYSVENSLCSEGNCTCPSSNSVHVLELKSCLPAVAFKDKCRHNSQCEALDQHTYCTTEARETCQCKEEYIYSMDNLQCIKMKLRHEYLNVLLAIGLSQGLIVTLTLTLYFRRKHMEKIRLRKRMKAANDNLATDLPKDSAVPNGSAIEMATNEKKVHFNTFTVNL